MATKRKSTSTKKSDDLIGKRKTKANGADKKGRDEFNAYRRKVYSAEAVEKAKAVILRGLKSPISTREFAGKHDLDPNTVRKAGQRLAREGKIKVRKAGALVQMHRA